MYILNYLYFAIITMLGLYYLYSSNHLLVHPYNKNLKLKLDGPEMFWVLTFSTGLFAFSAPAGLDLMAIRLLILELFCFIGLFVIKRKVIWTITIILYLLYILWLIIGLLYSPSPWYGIRVILKHLYPLAILLFSSAIVRDGEVFLKAALGSRFIAILSLFLVIFTFLDKIFPGVFWCATARAIHYITIVVFCLALFFYGPRNNKDLFLAFVFIIPCFIWIFRTSIVGTTLALTSFSIIKYKIKAIPFVAITGILFIVSIFTIPTLRDKMFFNPKSTSVEQLQSGGITKDDINSNGRFAMWDWSLDKFYKNKELTGTGTGSLQETFYSLRHPFGSIKICHNDYVQILCHCCPIKVG